MGPRLCDVPVVQEHADFPRASALWAPKPPGRTHSWPRLPCLASAIALSTGHRGFPHFECFFFHIVLIIGVKVGAPTMGAPRTCYSNTLSSLSVVTAVGASVLFSLAESTAFVSCSRTRSKASLTDKPTSASHKAYARVIWRAAITPF